VEAKGRFLVAAVLCAASLGCRASFGPVERCAPLPSPINVSKVLERNPSPSSQGPLTLDRAIEEALAASPGLRQIEQRLQAAEEQVRQAEAAFYPRIVFSQEFSLTDNPVFAFMQTLHQRRLSFAMDFNDPGVHQNVTSRIQGEWSIFEGGSRIYGRNAAVGQRDAVGFDLLAAKNKLVASVIESYFRWLQALAFLDVAEKAVLSARTDEALGEARVRAQVALASELLRLKTRTAEAEANMVSARASAQRLKAALERLIARPIGDEEVPSPMDVIGEPAKETVETNPAELVKTALRERPELQAIRSLIMAARERVRMAKADLLPKIGARVWWAWDSEEMRGGGESWLASFHATWPLFQGGLTLSRIREAASRLKELEESGHQLALDIALEVHQASATLSEARAKVEVASRRRDYSTKALEEIRAQYANDVATVDALLQSELEWTRAEVSYASALFEEKIAQAALRQALGELAKWTESKP
jgi:outer membrane protein